MDAYVWEGLLLPGAAATSSSLSLVSGGLSAGSGLPRRCSIMETSLVLSSAAWSSSLSTRLACSRSWRLATSESWTCDDLDCILCPSSVDLVIIVQVMQELPEVMTRHLAATPLTLALLVQGVHPHVLSRVLSNIIIYFNKPGIFCFAKSLD